MSLEVFGDEGDVGPDGYVTDERAAEMVSEAFGEVLPLVLKIIQAGRDGDKKKLIAYSRFLAEKLDYHTTQQSKWLTAKLDALESGVPELTIVPASTGAAMWPDYFPYGQHQMPYEPTWQMKEAGGEQWLEIRDNPEAMKGLTPMHMAEAIWMAMYRVAQHEPASTIADVEEGK